MSQTWNADDLRLRLREVFRQAEQERGILERPDPAMSPGSAVNVPREWRDFWLECHIRDFVIDNVLATLNWQVRSSRDFANYRSSNLVVEQRSDHTRTDPDRAVNGIDERRRRLDYLGYDRDTDRPLLVVEAKRPSFALPDDESNLSGPREHRLSEIIATHLEVQRNGATGNQDDLTVQWHKVIDQLRGYCRDIVKHSGEWPLKVVLTNGDWLIAFTDPENAFAEAGIASVNPRGILIFKNKDQLIRHCSLLWEELEYSNLSRAERSVQPTEVPFVADVSKLVSFSYGLRLTYSEMRTNYRRAPLLSVSPLILVRSESGSFLQVESSPWEAEVPLDKRHSIRDHVRKVFLRANELRLELETALGGRVLPVVQIEDHYKDADAFRLKPAVQQIPDPDASVYLLVTGTQTHFVLSTGLASGCRHHSDARSLEDAVAHAASPVVKSELNPRSYFIDGSEYHCAHRAVHAVRRQPVNVENRERCGPRSCEPNGAFCELWHFEEFLCCMSCVYQQVCAKTSVFSLPCPESVRLTTPATANNTGKAASKSDGRRH